MPTLTNPWGWHINWLAVTYNAYVSAGVREYYYAGGQRVAMRIGNGSGSTGVKILLGDHDRKEHDSARPA
jgi:hypothetical protein